MFAFARARRAKALAKKTVADRKAAQQPAKEAGKPQPKPQVKNGPKRSAEE
jgi:hypothetical protein